jgi:hypothetical protein
LHKKRNLTTVESRKTLWLVLVDKSRIAAVVGVLWALSSTAFASGQCPEERRVEAISSLTYVVGDLGGMQVTIPPYFGGYVEYNDVSDLGEKCMRLNPNVHTTRNYQVLVLKPAFQL